MSAFYQIELESEFTYLLSYLLAIFPRIPCVQFKVIFCQLFLFLIQVLKPAFNEALEEEVDRWTRNYVDVNGLARKLLEAERANKRLREELAKAKKALSKARYMATLLFDKSYCQP